MANESEEAPNDGVKIFISYRRNDSDSWEQLNKDLAELTSKLQKAGRIKPLPLIEYKRQPKDKESKDLVLTIEISEDSPVEEVAEELANLCKALNAYHIASGGNGLAIDDWDIQIAVREAVGV